MSLLKWFCLCFFVCMFGVESVNVSNGSRKKTIESEFVTRLHIKGALKLMVLRFLRNSCFL